MRVSAVGSELGRWQAVVHATAFIERELMQIAPPVLADAAGGLPALTLEAAEDGSRSRLAWSVVGGEHDIGRVEIRHLDGRVEAWVWPDREGREAPTRLPLLDDVHALRWRLLSANRPQLQWPPAEGSAAPATTRRRSAVATAPALPEAFELTRGAGRCRHDHARRLRRARCAAERGAAVVLALLTVSFAAMLAAAALADFGHGLEMLGGRHDQAQAWQLGRAAVDWSRNILADDARQSATDHLDEMWTTEIPVTAIASDPAEGRVGGQIRDLSGRFNLNDLAPGGQPDAQAVARFARLLAIAGMNGAQAGAAAQAVARSPAGRRRGWRQWRLATAAAGGGVRFVEVRELATLGVIPSVALDALDAHLVAAPSGAPININTASAEVLAAVVDNLPLDAARTLVAARDRAWFRNLGDFQGRLPEGAGLPAGRLLDVRSRYFLVTITAAYGDAVLTLQAMLERESNWPTLLWYHTP